MIKRIGALLIALTMLLTLSGVSFSQAARADASTYRVEVDIDNQITTVYRCSDGAIVRQMICSTGRNSATPRGTFHLERSRAADRSEWYYIGQYACYVRYPTRIRGPILFHSLPYAKTDLDTLDAEALSQMGSPVSHGCIRLYWEDARWIAQNCPDGTEVRIFKGSDPLPDLRRILLLDTYFEGCGMTYDQFTASDYVATTKGVLGRGASGGRVTALQRRLGGLGLFAGELTGRYDCPTIAAVMAFQEAVGAPVTGLITGDEISLVNAQTEALGDAAVLDVGMNGPAVAAFQRVLSGLHLYLGEADGLYSEEVADAVRDCCLFLDMDESSRATPDLRREATELLDELKSKYAGTRVTPIITRETTSIATAKQEADLHERADADSPVLITAPEGGVFKVLKRGPRWTEVSRFDRSGYVENKCLAFSTGEYATARWGVSVDRIGLVELSGNCMGGAVEALQNRLRALGFYSAETHPEYDEATQAAVAAYQAASGRDPTGVCAVDEQLAIFESDAVTGTETALRKGLNSPAVAALQRALKALGLYDGLSHGRFDRATASAVRQYTKDHGLRAREDADPDLQRAILAAAE